MQGKTNPNYNSDRKDRELKKKKGTSHDEGFID